MSKIALMSSAVAPGGKLAISRAIDSASSRDRTRFPDCGPGAASVGEGAAGGAAEEGLDGAPHENGFVGVRDVDEPEVSRPCCA